MATVKRISPASALKVGAVVYAFFGLVVGVCTALFSMIAGSLGEMAGATFGARAIGLGFGASAIIIMPIAYAVVGAIGGAVGAALYNVAAGWVGGVEVDIS
jgi:hypothetical protein